MVGLRHLVAGWLLMAACGTVASAQSGSGWSNPEGAGKVISLTGQVSVLKDGQPWALYTGSTVQLRQIIVTGPDGFAVFQVSDGSTFEVYPNSRVTFRNNPADWKDLLDVWLGRVKIHIQKLGGRPNRNRINTPTAVISVRGTIFDVVVEEEESTLVVVEEGQVAVQHAILPVTEPRILNSGDYIRVYRNQPLADRGMDKSGIVQHAMRAATEALYRIVYRSPSGGTTPGGPPVCGAGRSCDTDNGGTPPPPGGGTTTPPPPPGTPTGPPPPPGG